MNSTASLHPIIQAGTWVFFYTCRTSIIGTDTLSANRKQDVDPKLLLDI